MEEKVSFYLRIAGPAICLVSLFIPIVQSVPIYPSAEFYSVPSTMLGMLTHGGQNGPFPFLPMGVAILIYILGAFASLVARSGKYLLSMGFMALVFSVWEYTYGQIGALSIAPTIGILVPLVGISLCFMRADDNRIDTFLKGLMAPEIK